MKKIEIRKRKLKDIGAPNFMTMFNGNGLDDPLSDLDASQEAPVDLANHEASAVLMALKEDRKNRLERYREQNSLNFYLVMCFQSEKQKDEFLEGAGWQPAEPGSLYFDGLEIAKQLEISLTPVKLERKIGGRVTKRVKGMEVITHADN